jgi:calcineurin-like phosphoesterase
MTSGNHVWKKEDPNFLATLPQFNLVTPHNDPRTPAGQGYKLVTVNHHKILIINLLAQNGMTLDPDSDAPENNVASPFQAAAEILKTPPRKKPKQSLLIFMAN